MERAIVEAPDDPQRWAVYSDWLQERGAPLGERIATFPRERDDARWLDPFSGDEARGDMQVEWAHGVPKTVTLRSLPLKRTDWPFEERLASLARTASFRFLRALVVDAGSFWHSPLRLAVIQHTLESIGDAFPMLERFEFGPASLDVPVFDAGKAREQVALTLARMRRSRSRFVTTVDTVRRPWGPAWLHVEHVSASAGRINLVEIDGGRRRETELELGTRAEVHRDGAGIFIDSNRLRLTLQFVRDRWLLRLRQNALALKVNGRFVLAVQLRGGDVLEYESALRIRFEA
jgi:uncharacterized protein (TIGR02996 family)